MKKIIAGIMAGVMLLGSATVAFADENAQDAAAEKASMLEALTTVKKRVTIPESLENFDYSHSTSQNDDSFTFTWSTEKDEDYSYLTISIKGTIITNYYTYTRTDYGDYSEKLGKLTMPQLCAAAESELKKLNPTLTDRIEINSTNVSAYLGNTEVYFPINRVFKGIPVSNDRGSISINKDSGELISFRLNWHSNASFKSADKAIGNAAAQTAYASMVGLKPVYRVTYDYDKDTYTTSIVYVQTDYGEINAFTGKKSSFQDDGYYDTTNADCEDDCVTVAESADGGVTFTQNELNELDKNAKLITKEKLAEMLTGNKYFNYSDDMKLENFNVYSRKVNGVKSYYINASYSLDGYTEYDDVMPVIVADDVVDDVEEKPVETYAYLNVTLNGETGEIQDYGYYDNKDRNAASLDESKAAALTKKIATELAGDKFSEYKLDSSGVNSYQPYNSYTDTYEAAIYTGYYAYYTRYVNGIEVENDAISVNLNGDLSLSGYSLRYTDNVDFISTKGMLTVDGALAKIWKQTQLSLNYKVRTLDNITKSVLVYTAGTNLDCDAFTGELLYNYSYTNEKPEYSDLSGKLGAKVEMLRMYGIYFAAIDGKFSADTSVKIGELSSFIGRFVPLDSVGNDAGSTKPASRALIIKELVSSAYGSSVADMKGIFKSPFDDVSEDSEYVGYLAIACASGIIKSGGKFNPDKAMTRGELAELIYDYLSK